MVLFVLAPRRAIRLESSQFSTLDFDWFRRVLFKALLNYVTLPRHYKSSWFLSDIVSVYIHIIVRYNTIRRSVLGILVYHIISKKIIAHSFRVLVIMIDSYSSKNFPSIPLQMVLSPWQFPRPAETFEFLE